MKQAALDYARQHRDENLKALQELLRIPSISTLPERRADVELAAHRLASHLRQIGVPTVEVVPTSLHPMVFAEDLRAGPGAPTLLAYGHYDVQPVDPVAEWKSPPFEPTIRGQDLYCRGACDDKGQVVAILAAVEAYLQTAGHLPINLRFMFEGEEEVGSPSMDGFLEDYHRRLTPHAVLVCDTDMPDADTPAITYGTRGMVSLELEVSGPAHDLHSGMAGGAVDNPLNALVWLLSRLHDRATGRVAIPGFYDRVRPISDGERALLSGAMSDDEFRQLCAVPALVGEAGFSAVERTSVRPTLDIHGIVGGFTGPGTKTVIPATVTAKVTMRLVPDQDPADVGQLFCDYVHSIAPPSVRVQVHLHGGCAASLVDYGAPAVQAAAEALQLAWGVPPTYVRSGGSIPLVSSLQRAFGVPVVMAGFGLPDDNAHAPNEKFHLPNFHRGTEALIHYFTTLRDLISQEGTES